nr:hypothetical protein [Tanacetum cinerariifolium]
MIDYLDADEGVSLVVETQGRNDQDMFDTSILDDEEVVAAGPVPTTGEVVTTASVEVSTADEHVTTTSNDLLLSGKDRLKLTELMELCTQLQSRILTLETTKANQALKIRSLKRRVKKLEKKANKKTHKLKRLYKIDFSTRVESSEDAGLCDQEDASKHGRMIIDLDADERVALEVGTADPVPTADEIVTTVGEVVTTAGVKVSIAAITSQIYMDKITLAEALIDIKTSKPKAKGIVIQEPNYELAARLPEEEIGELTIEEKSRLFVELMDKRKKYFARLKAKKIISKPPTKTQKRKQMCTYLKNMANYKHSQLKNKSFEEIQMLSNNTIKWIESFVPMDTELVKGSKKATEGSSKRVGGKLEKEDAKRHRIEEENESAELKRCLEIILDNDDDMFKNFNIEDLEVLWSIVKAKFKKIKPVDDMDNLLFQTLKTMFEHHVLNLHQMWNDVRLQVDYGVEMAYDLLRLIRRQINEGYDYDQFVQNYNMHGMRKNRPKLHAMLKLAENASAVLAIRNGHIQKPKPQARGKGKNKGKSKLAYYPRHTIPPPAKKDHPAKDAKSHRCYKLGHWRRNCPLYLVELKKNKANTSSTSGIFTIELYLFPKTNSWIYDTGYGTRICNTIRGHKGIQKLIIGALDLLLKSIDDESFDVCVSCISGKMARKPFTHAGERANDLLGLIHGDVCGPFRTTSRKGANYYVTFTNNFSRYGYV